MLPQSAVESRRAQQRRSVAALALVRREWAKVDLAAVDESWAAVAGRVTLLTVSAQLGAAYQGAASVPAVLADLGVEVDPLGVVNPSAFAGVASDGRPLDSLLEGAKVRVKESQSLAAGGAWLEMAVHTQVADAGRGAAGVAITARPKVGWVRMVNPPCCARCAVLAGKWFKWNQGFDRHWKCDCQHVASTEAVADGLTAEPPLDQVTGLSKAERSALTEGADMGQVVNARRGSKGMTTTEGTTRRGVAGARLKGQRRLTPAGIYRVAAGNRDEALRLLTDHGYLL